MTGRGYSSGSPSAIARTATAHALYDRVRTGHVVARRRQRQCGGNVLSYPGSASTRAIHAAMFG